MVIMVLLLTLQNIDYRKLANIYDGDQLLQQIRKTRYAELKKIIEVNQFIKLVKWRKVESVEHVEEELKKIVDENGEGLILADPNGMYEDGHVDQILKYKPKKDREAEVIGYETNEDGSRLKSLVVRDRKITFHIGTGLKIKHRYGYEKRFPIGCKVSYWYEILGKNGKPRTPIFKGVRVDLN